MSANPGDDPTDIPPVGTPAHGLVRVDVIGLDVVAPAVGVLLADIPTVRRATDIPGLQILIDIAVANRARSVPGVPAIEVLAEVMIPADELHPGDVVDYCGHLHRVTKVDRGDGWSWPVASDDDGWAMALGHDLIVLHRLER